MNDNLYNGPYNGPQANWSPDYQSEKQPIGSFKLATYDDKFDGMLKQQIDDLRKQLAESQAREAGLKRALEEIAAMDSHDSQRRVCCAMQHIALLALASPEPGSAELREMAKVALMAKRYSQCAVEFDGDLSFCPGPLDDLWDAEEAMSEQTLTLVELLAAEPEGV